MSVTYVDAGGYPAGFLEDIRGEDFEITYRRFGAVAQISFSRPANNHFSIGLIQSLADTFERADEDPSVRATVLASEGKHFCAGADLLNSAREPAKLYEQGIRLFALTKPMVAAVQGAAIGGGLGLALVADFRVVAPSSRLAANFVKLGTHPGFGITYTLPRMVGRQAAADILLTGRRLTGQEAVECGLADRIVSEHDLRDSALALAAAIAENAPLAVEATRSTLRDGLADRVRQQTTLEAGKQMQLFTTEDYAEGVRAVAERRPGVWTRS